MIEINKEIKELLFLGPQGSYCETAKNQFLSLLPAKDVEQKPFSTVKSIIEYVKDNEYAAAVIPVENSIEGIVRETMDNMLNLNDPSIQISAETVIPVNHCLVSKAGSIRGIKKIISHPQALAQCRNFIEKHFGSNIEQIEKASTSKAAQELTELDDSYAAIANKRTAEIFKLNVLAKNINDEKDNKTRFILLSRCTTTPTDSDKTSIAFATKNQSGALVKVLNVFDSLNINLLYIDSRPSKKNLGEYVFFVDFEGHIKDEPSQKVLDLIKLNTNYINILGSYRRF
jgi:P-protein